MLSPAAEQLINDYLDLPFKDVRGVRCPYFNNARLRQRGQLRALVGKGSPKEIVEEAEIIALQRHAGLFYNDGRFRPDRLPNVKPADLIGKFLVDQNLGVDCSGFVTRVLRAHLRETRQIDLLKKLVITRSKNPLRRLIVRLRPIENIGVRCYADPANSNLVMNDAAPRWQEIKPGDFIIMLDTGPNHNRDHIVIITENRFVENAANENPADKNSGRTIRYVAARSWENGNKYDQGVYEGIIMITDPAAGLLAQTWTEKNLSGERNGTFVEARQAKQLEIRRLKLLAV